MTQRITININNDDIQYTNFEKVKEFSRSFEVPHFDTPQTNIFTQNPELVKSRLDLIKEKVDELAEAIREHDMVKVVDALSNILYVVYSVGDLFGFDLDSAYDIVHKSNMSKLCQNEQEAQETVAWYQLEFQEGQKPYDSPYYYQGESGKWIIKNRSTGKVLKSINYTPAQLQGIAGMESYVPPQTETKTQSDVITNFQMVKEFSRSFEVPHFDTPQPNIFTENPALVKLRLDLIKEEVGELAEAIREHDMVEVVDALADILYVVYGAGDSFGLDLDSAYDIVHKSNMSKLCQNEQEAQETLAWYQQEFQDGEKLYDSPYCYQGDSGKWIIKNRSTGKLLKSINYRPPQFRGIVGME